MKAQINDEIGVRAMQSIMKELKASAPGIEKLDFVSSWGLWLNGHAWYMRQELLRQRQGSDALELAA